MKRQVLFIVMLMTCSMSMASKIEWQYGVIILQNQDVIYGEVSFDPINKAVLHRINNTIHTYPAFKVSSFIFHDQKQDIVRSFFTVPETKNFRRTIEIYEHVATGRVQILRKRSYLPSPADGYGSNDKEKQLTTDHVLGYDYFYQINGQVTNVRRFRKDVKPLLFQDYEMALKAYIKANHLNLGKLKDQIALVAYYNTLHKTVSGVVLN